MSFIGRLFAPGGDLEPQPLRLSTRTDEPRKLIVGRAATGGAFAFHGLSDSEGRTAQTDNEFLHQVIVLAGHECVGVNRVWADGELVLTSGMTHGDRIEIPAYRDGRRARLWLTFYGGRRNQTAAAFLRQAVIRPQRWRETDRLLGCAYVTVTAQFDDDSLTSPPEFIFEIDGAPLYDRRRDSTAGGDGEQRWDDPSTWLLTSNPAVAADHYQLGMVGGQNNDEIIFGMGLKPWQVPFEEFQANADLCDEQVDSLSGPQSRYAANGVLSADADHRENITRLARAMAAQPFDVGGRIVIRPVQARAITLTLNDADLVSGETYELDPTPSGTDLVNLVRGTYREPSDRHNELPYPQVQDDTQIAGDGRVFEHTLNLNMETSSDRAQRLARIELEVQRRRDRLSEVFMPIANVLEVGDWFTRETSLRGGVTKTYEVTDKTSRTDLTVEIEARETDPSVSAFALDDLREVELPNAIDPIPTVRPDVPDSLSSPAERSGGGAILPTISLTVTPVPGQTFASVDFFEVEYGVSNGSADALGIAEGQAQLLRFEKQSDTEANRFEITGLLPATAYAWRVRAVRNGRRGDFSPFREVSTLGRFLATAASSAAPGSSLSNALEVLRDDGESIAAAAAQAQAAAAQALERLDPIDGNGARLDTIEATTAQTADRLTSTQAQFSSSAASLLPNHNFSLVDDNGKPVGIRPIEGVAGLTQLSVDDYGLVISGAPDPSIGFGFPALPVEPGSVYEVAIRWRSSTGSANGVYFRFNEFAGNLLPSGVSHVGIAASSGDEVVQRSRLTELQSNGPSQTEEQESVFEYTVPDGVNQASFSIYNWSGHPGDLHIAEVVLKAKPQAAVAGDFATSAQLVSEQQARASGDAAQAQALSALNASFSGQITSLTSSVAQVQTAVADESAARAAIITDLRAEAETPPSRPSVIENFNQDFTVGNPLTDGQVVAVQGEGDVRQFGGVSRILANRNSIPIADRTYNLHARARVTVNGTGNIAVAGFGVYSAGGTYLGVADYGVADTDWRTTDGWVDFTRTVHGAAVKGAFPAATYIRGIFWGGRKLDGKASGATWQIAELRLEDGTQAAAITEIREAISTGSSSRARLGFSVNTNTNQATIEALAIEGDGQWNGSAIRLQADQIELDGDVIVTGSLTSRSLAVGAATNSGGFSADAGQNVPAGVWTTVATTAIATQAGTVFLTGSCDLEGTFQQSTSQPPPSARVRLLRGGSQVRSRDVLSGSLSRAQNGATVTWVLRSAADIQDLDPAPTGNQSYRLQVLVNGGGGSVTASNRSLAAIELRR